MKASTTGCILLLLMLGGMGRAQAAEPTPGVALAGFHGRADGDRLRAALALELGSGSPLRVVDGDRLRPELTFGAAPRIVRQIGHRHELDFVVVGRRASERGRASKRRASPGLWAVEVRSGHSGEVVGRHEVNLVGAPGEREALVQLAQAVAQDAGRPPVEASPPGRAGAENDPTGLLALRGDAADEPITIESEELAFESQPDESRILLFERDVSVRQGEMTLRAAELEAFYPPQESQPSRLVARGGVEIVQPGQRATCAEAEYLRLESRLSCRGDAELVQGCDVVRGSTIEIDLTTDRARVVGGARVVIQPREGNACEGQGP